MKRTNRNGSVQETGGAGVYVRVSTEEQARLGVSLDAQLARVEAYLTSAGLTLAQIYREEGVSASNPLADRPQGSALIEAIRSGRVKHVVALKLDRLFRSAEDALRRTSEWDKAGIALHLVDMGGQSMNTGSAMGRMLLTMMAAFAEFERNLIAERTTFALAHKRSQAKVYANTPYGCERTGEGITKSMARRGGTETARGESGPDLVENAAERMVIEQMKIARAGGLSLRAIAGMLNAEKVPCKRGGQRWYASTVGKILSNDVRLPEAA